MSTAEDETKKDFNPLDALAGLSTSCAPEPTNPVPDAVVAKPATVAKPAGGAKRKRPAKFSTQNAVECLAQPIKTKRQPGQVA